MGVKVEVYVLICNYFVLERSGWGVLRFVFNLLLYLQIPAHLTTHSAKS